MIGYYQLVDKLNEQLKSVGFRTVTVGDVFEVDLKRQSIFPLAHIITEPSILNQKTYGFTFTIIAMDLVDFNKQDLREELDPVYGIDNLQDVWHDIHFKLATIAQVFQRGEAFTDLYQVEGAPTVDPFKERFENLLAGWTMSITITVPAYATIC